MITIKFNTDNGAFDNCEGIESARIIVDLCKHLEFHSKKLSNDTYIIKDLNGHKLDQWKQVQNKRRMQTNETNL